MPGETYLHDSSLAAEIPKKLRGHLSMCSHDSSGGVVGVLGPEMPG